VLPTWWQPENGRGLFHVGVADRLCRLEGFGNATHEVLLPGSAELPDLLDRGLAGLVEGARSDANGHLVVADWLEEHVGPAPAAALRASAAALPEPRKGEWLGSHGFAWRWLDRDVLLYLARAQLWRGRRQPRGQETGYALGLLHGPAGRPRRWERWLPEGPAAQAGKRLEEELQAGSSA
jgi:hypothetical protein